MVTTYTYTTKRGNLKETFDSKGYQTLEYADGRFICEHQLSTIGLKLAEIQLQNEFLKRGLEYTKETI